MTDVTKKVLCGHCHINVEERTEADGQVMAVCPQCGNTDTLDNAIREATEYFAEKTVGEMLSPLANSSNDFVKVTVTHSPERTYRFIVD
jgi:predicted RNA-binding Zn-ribbon protein involved in translation (DUF1610 family)